MVALYSESSSLQVDHPFINFTSPNADTKNTVKVTVTAAYNSWLIILDGDNNCNCSCNNSYFYNFNFSYSTPGTSYQTH